MKNHKDRLIELMERDKTDLKDLERKALLFILSGNHDLFSKVDAVYDFKNHHIRYECLENEEVDFSSSSKAMIKLAYNLFNGYDQGADVLSIFRTLDEKNSAIALEAIRIRFSL